MTDAFSPDTAPPSPDFSDAAPPADDAGPRVLRDATISMERANVLGLAMIPAFGVLVIAHGVAWGWGSVREGAGFVFSLKFFLPAFLIAIVVHEALHGLGFLAVGRAPRSAVHFGVHRATMSPFAGCRVPLRAWAYRVAVLLPGLALGAVPAAWGLATGTGWLTVWGVVMLIAAAGDLAAFWAMRSVPARALVLDHPERVGCRVVEG